MILKAIIIFAILKFFDKKGVSIKTALTLSQVGEFAFVIFALLEKYSLVDSSILQKLIVAVVISMILTPFILKYLTNIVSILDRDIDKELPALKAAKIEDHTIIIGYNNIGRKIAHKLTKLGETYILIDKRIENVKEGIKNGDNIIFGNAANKTILESLNIKTAQNVIITTLNEENTHLITENILALNPKIKIIVLTEGYSIQEEFYKQNKIIRVNRDKEMAKKIINLFFKLKEENGSN
jgi:CPA2 family monovalent cation:H+ antiporter-2